MLALETVGLSKRFGPLEAVRNVSLRVQTGAIYGLLGPNGSGKTTTLACALGWQRSSAGTVKILGLPPRHLARARGRLGVAADTPDLVDNLTVQDNLRYAAHHRGHRGGRSPSEVLALVGAAGLERRRAGKLSLGQKKRVSLARALLGDPELLLLDEPLAALDPLGVRDMLGLLSELSREGRTLILSSHRLHEMQQLVSHVGILHRGRLLREAPLAQLLDERRTRLALVCAPTARPLLDAVAGVTLLGETPEGGHVRYELDSPTVPPEELNRRLVSAGIAVAALIPERADLASVFEGILAEDGA